MKKSIYLFLFMSFGFAKAQVPGYLGMRNSFGYEPGISIALNYPNSHFNTSTLGFVKSDYYGGYNFPKPEFIALNVTHTFVYDRVIKRNASFNASFSFYKSGTALDPLSSYDNVNNVQLNYNGGLTKISGIAMSVSYRRYKNYLAPIGLYAGYFLGFGSSSAMTHSSNTDSTQMVKTKAFTPKFGYVYGRQNIFFDKLIVDRGFSFDLLGLMLGFLSKRKTENNGSNNGAVAAPADYFQSQLKTRMYYRDFITFYIGGKYMF